MKTKKSKELWSMIFENNGDFISPGVFKVCATQKTAYNPKAKFIFTEDKYNFTYVLSKKHNGIDKTTKLSNKIISLSYFYKKNSPAIIFEGNAILISSNGNELRFIDFKKSVLCTRYNSILRYRRILELRNIWSKYFNTIPIIEKNENLLYTIEDFVKKRPIYAEEKLIFILKSNVASMPKIPKHIASFTQNDYNSIKYFVKRLNIFELYDQLIQTIKTDCSIHTMTHGDATFLNVIYDGNDFYFIDFENVATRVFFFDPLYFIYFYSCNVDFSLINNYLSGMYDSLFSEVFRAVGLDFNKSGRCLYILCFLYYQQKRHPILNRQFLKYICDYLKFSNLI